MVAALERSCPKQVRLPEVLVFFSQVTLLDIMVHAMGRQSGGCEWDLKGLVYPNIQLNGMLSRVHSHHNRSRITPCCAAMCRTRLAMLSGYCALEPAPERRVRRFQWR